jgi:hypothetical protein
MIQATKTRVIVGLETQFNQDMNSAQNNNQRNSGYIESGYQTKDQNPYGANQGNYEDGYQENPYDRSNLADNAYTDTPGNTNPQLELEL